MEHKLSEAEHSRGQLRRICSKFCTPVFLEAFALTFLAGVHAAETSPNPYLRRCGSVLAYAFSSGTLCA